MKTILTIAGFDPSGGAGLQADLKVFQSFGVHGLSVVTAITAQNSQGVKMVQCVSLDVFERQLKTLLDDIIPDAVKIGMLYSIDIVERLSEIIREYSLKNIVIDPIITSTSGKSLALNGTIETIAERLFPFASIVIPNMEEAQYLTKRKINTLSDMKYAAVEILNNCMCSIIITGGHLEGEAVDIFYDRNGYYQISSKKYQGQFHGTGCMFSSAVTVNLGLRKTPQEAFISAKKFIENAINTSYKIGIGAGGMNFLNVSRGIS